MDFAYRDGDGSLELVDDDDDDEDDDDDDDGLRRSIVLTPSSR